MAAREARRRLEVSPRVLRRLISARPDYFPVLLDSAARVASGARAARTLLAAAPGAFLGLTRDNRLVTGGELPPVIGALQGRTGGFLDALDSWWRIIHAGEANGDALAGGWVVYLGYEMAQEVEPGLRLPAGRLPWKAVAMRVRGALVHDAQSEAVEIVVGAQERALLDEIEQQVLAVKAAPASPQEHRTGAMRLAEEPAERFLARVQRAQEHIRAGDIYQANLSRWWRTGWPHATEHLYERLRAANPAPFAAYARFPGMEILCSSPERLLAITGRGASTRPIAGTRPRSGRPGEDMREKAELVAHPKERAEHVMLIDLERNDLGRVCEAGSIRVDEYMAVESFAHVHHIVSSVSGTLRPSVTPVEALRAVFPGGTITGVPKVRCMQIIAALEGEGRDAYTGSLGWLSSAGDADFNILIRTLTLADGQLEARTGAGIVADSNPERELEETRAKARGLLAALGVNA